MDTDLQNLEAGLKGMTPRGLDDDLMRRLSDAMDGKLLAADDSLRVVEASLAKLKPVAPTDALTDRLVGVLSKVPFPVNEKVVMFPGGTMPAQETRPQRGRWVLAAAAVAMMGAFLAWKVSPGPETSGGGKVVGNDTTVTPRIPPAMQADAGAFMPAGFNSGVSDASDQGVVWSKDQTPMRVVRVTYRDQMSFLNERGEQVELEVPRVEYVLVPEKID